MRKSAFWAAAWMGLAAPPAFAGIGAQSIEALKALPIEELANVEVNSAMKRPELLSRTPAAIFVIRGEDIQRSGYTTLAEALRLAPQLNVVRANSSSYAIAARGFNTIEASIKMLVLIDGRSVYTPLHGGVFWDQQQVMLEDVDRIEVIRGPGATLYGANAMNGVINVITKRADETQGGLASLSGGNLDRQGAVRYGTEVGPYGAARAYVLGYGHDALRTAAGEKGGDEWNGGQFGFRSDFVRGADALTVQGDRFDNNVHPNEAGYTGGNMLARWTRTLSLATSLTVQGYYDRADRIQPGVTDQLTTYDLEAQFNAGRGRHAMVAGAGYRVSNDMFDNTTNAFVLTPMEEDIAIANVFAQDTMTLRPGLNLTLGAKVEHSSYSGAELLPNVRLGWEVGDALIWGAVSRAVRTPSRFDRDLNNPGVLDAAKDFQAEEVIAYEVGWRGTPARDLVLSVAFFYNEYDDLRALARSPDTGNLVFGNVLTGHTYGVESWADYQVASWWRLSAGFAMLEKQLHLDPPGVTTAFDQHFGNDPDYQVSLRSRMDLRDDIAFDVGIRKVDELDSPAVPAYAALDARLGWHPTDQLELWVAGFNILEDRHAETRSVATRREIPRSIAVGARVQF